MGKAAQTRATKTCRARLTQRGFTRIEITALDADRVRATPRTAVVGEPAMPGRILSALRRSPLVGADLDVSRSREGGREVDL